ncbi:hypothetical protein [Noviherbaspirillum aridicola]|uniref:Uncharacterized protein n=1 Tax=Noviherbaspirillum aridicola TaxID=2849687 RepID=A0ABQ4Q9F6_9BURK|nr:hypothetical protein [Noviherbaspirillum aridicola]GIZ53681.1 hypothetical protein NCCP691_36950 [Noviherbaspirillum aridicola]
MKTLIIADLSLTTELDRAEMAAVQGGYGKEVYAQYLSSMPKAPEKPAISFDAMQSLGQAQNTMVNNGNNAAFVCGITSSVNPSQHGANTINFG